MKQYYVERSQNMQDNKVHHEDCEELPQMQNRTFLGVFEHCREAMEAAIKYYDQVNGCKICSVECYTEQEWNI